MSEERFELFPLSEGKRKEGFPDWEEGSKKSVKARIRIPADSSIPKTVVGVVLTPEISHSEYTGEVLDVFGSLDVSIYYEPLTEQTAGNSLYEMKFDEEGLDNYFNDLTSKIEGDNLLEIIAEEEVVNENDLKVLKEAREDFIKMKCLRLSIPYYFTLDNLFQESDKVIRLFPKVEEVECQILEPRLLELQVEMNLNASFQQVSDNKKTAFTYNSIEGVEPVVDPAKLKDVEDYYEEEKKDISSFSEGELENNRQKIKVESEKMGLEDEETINELPVEIAQSVEIKIDDFYSKRSDENLTNSINEEPVIEKLSVPESNIYDRSTGLPEKDIYEEARGKIEEKEGFPFEIIDNVLDEMINAKKLDKRDDEEGRERKETIKEDAEKEISEVQEKSELEREVYVEEKTSEMKKEVDERISPVEIGYKTGLVQRRRPSRLERETRMAQKRMEIQEESKDAESLSRLRRAPRPLAKLKTMEENVFETQRQDVNNQQEFEKGKSLDKKRSRPGTGRFKRQTNTSRYYLVQSGDSWQKIADEYQVSIAKIMEVNKVEDSEPDPGTRIKIPSP